MTMSETNDITFEEVIGALRARTLSNILWSHVDEGIQAIPEYKMPEVVYDLLQYIKENP
jgi:hypothetical protein